MAIKIITDSTADYELPELKAKDIICVPMSINFNDQHYLDGVNLSKDEFFNRLTNHNDFPTTSQPSPESFLAYFKEAKANNDAVIVILISSALSGTFQSANIAKEMAEYEHIYIIDSSTATIGIKFLADTAVNMRQDGKSILEIVETLEHLKTKIRVLAVADTLEYLYKGGRLSKAQAGLGTLAHLKPIITIDSEGSISVLSKSIGLAKARGQLVKLLELAELNTEYPLHLIYAHDNENCLKLKDKLKQSNILVSDDAIYSIGPTIGAHIGPGAFGVVFVEK